MSGNENEEKSLPKRDLLDFNKITRSYLLFKNRKLNAKENVK